MLILQIESRRKRAGIEWMQFWAEFVMQRLEIKISPIKAKKNQKRKQKDLLVQYYCNLEKKGAGIELMQFRVEFGKQIAGMKSTQFRQINEK